MKTAASAIAGFSVVPRHVLGGQGHNAASETVNVVMLVLLFCVMAAGAQSNRSSPRGKNRIWDISVENNRAVISAGILERVIDFDTCGVETKTLMVSGRELVGAKVKELSVSFYKAKPNVEPEGITPGTLDPIDWRKAASPCEANDVTSDGPCAGNRKSQWVELCTVEGDHWGKAFDCVSYSVSRIKPGVTRLIIRGRAISETPLGGVSIDLYYEMYQGHPAVRKWVEITNNSPNWLKIENLTIEELTLSPKYRHRSLLTPKERGTDSSVVSFGNKNGSCGLIAASEIPSALRAISDTGAMGYRKGYFEWVIGPAERFVSEPVFYYAYSGEVKQTVSDCSSPLDRTLEGPYRHFLEQYVGIVGDPSAVIAPLWCSWTDFYQKIDDQIIRQQAKMAAKAGFAGFLIDAGWGKGKTAWDAMSTEPDEAKFPDFDSTCRYVRSAGMKLGLWVPCFRYPDSKDLKILPEAKSQPPIERKKAMAMSFTSRWADYFANDVVSLHDRYGAGYVKQDYSNIKFGDIATDHQARTRKESVLRGLRRLFEVQDVLRHRVLTLTNEVTHEIYWGTPGAPADIAVLKHAAAYHIPPNDCKTDWKHDDLIKSCYRARKRFFAHRGLPLYCIEYYAAPVCHSLTPEVQDRQICSWLFGVPNTFAGDLTSAKQASIEHYSQRFELIKRLQAQYNIFANFQFSGVPRPTDVGWHWWGKLDELGCGAVVVMRGRGGENHRAINVPWVKGGKEYRVRALFSDNLLGHYSGEQLHEGVVKLALPVYGQEILEITSATHGKRKCNYRPLL